MYSFHDSSHAKYWLVASTESANAGDLSDFTRAEVQAVKRNYIAVLAAVGRQLRLRQTVTATAMMYFWRFYLHHSFTFVREAQEQPDCHPDWIAPTCLSLACKVQECPLTDSTVLANALQKVKEDPTLHFGFHVDSQGSFMSKIMSNEYVLLDALQSQLLVFHPYQDILRLATDFAEAASSDNADVTGLTQLCWNTVNDSYRCDACLLFAPYDIALAALLIAAEKKQMMTEKRATDWWIRIPRDFAPIKSAMTYILKHAYPALPDSVELNSKLCDQIYSIWSKKKKHQGRRKLISSSQGGQLLGNNSNN